MTPPWTPHDDHEEHATAATSLDGVNHAQEPQEQTSTPLAELDRSRERDAHTPQHDIPSIPPHQPAAQKHAPASETMKNLFSPQQSDEHTRTQPPITLTLLKQIRCWLRADDGTVMEVPLRSGENAIRLIQLAYIAWRKGASIDRDKMLTYVLSRGKRREMTTEQLGEVFDAAKRYLRQDLGRAVQTLERHGHPVSAEIDFFGNEPGFYWLHASCHVIDLETIEAHYHTIYLARKEGLLDEKRDGSIPDWVAHACQQLIEAYPGDFLHTLTEKFPEEFGPWVKEPITFYRDCYLDALLILATDESARGKNSADENGVLKHNEEHCRHHRSRAAQLFYDYAMVALNNRWDQKVKFTYRHGKDGERVIRAERALRRCVVELGQLGNPDMIDQVYLAFKERIALLSEGNWKPDATTESDVREAKRTTSAYRFSPSLLPATQPGHHHPESTRT
jgi:hypothetical protein